MWPCFLLLLDGPAWRLLIGRLDVLIHSLPCSLITESSEVVETARDRLTGRWVGRGPFWS